MSYSNLFNKEASGQPPLQSRAINSYTPMQSNDDAVRIQKETTHQQLSKTGDAAEVGLIALGNENADSKNNVEQKKKRDQEFNKLLDRLREHRLWLMAQMQDIQDRIEELTNDIEECGRTIDAMKEFMYDLKQNGAAALDDDGYPKDNPKAKAAIVAWEQKNHKKLDLTSADAMSTLLIITTDIESDQKIKADARDVEQKKWDELNEDWQITNDAITEFEEGGYANSTNISKWDSWLTRKEAATDANTANKGQIVNNRDNAQDFAKEDAASSNPLNSMPGLS